ncbi:MFS transporter [Nocardioides sp. R-C-SC26]|uniref:MFS transporter n=1 Tax=Nocardioides sp. R-C-SC26 TaxID=2870414 RepID=UPI001E2AED9A|nr:MFS transporter [Nocardioides sp. R-C-SC26]
MTQTGGLDDPLDPLDPIEAADVAHFADDGGRALPGVLAPFRHAAYRRLAVALVFTAFAGGVWIVALVWEVIRIGGGPGMLSAVSTASAVGVLLPALAGGVLADRVPQKLILLGVGTLELTGVIVVMTLSLTGTTQAWHLVVIAFGAGVGMAFYYPAYSAWLPALVDEADLMAVNGFEGMVRPTIGQAVGPAVAGLVVGMATSGAAMGVAAGAHSLGLMALITVPLTAVRRPVDEDGEPVAPGSPLTEMREGIGYMIRTPWLLATLLFAALMLLAIMGPLEVLVPFLIKDQLGGGPGDHALVLAAFGIGGAAGSLTMGSLPMPRRYLTVMNLTWGLGCLPFLLIGNASHVWVVIACAFAIGVTFSAPMVIWGTLLQRRVPRHLLGRVASLDFFISVSLMPVSMALAGPLAHWVGLTTTFVIAGIVPGLAAVFFTLAFKLTDDELRHPLRDGGESTPSP